jgi:hypothetical protein
MKHDYDQRFFRTVSNAPGREVIFGTLLAKADEEGRLDMTGEPYRWHVNDGAEVGSAFAPLKFSAPS